MNIRRISLTALLLLASACSTAPETSTSTAIPGASVAPTATPVVEATIAPTLDVATTASPAPVTYLPPECQGRPIATIPPATTVAEPTPSLKANPPLTPDEQLGVFDELAGKIAEVYLYPDFNGLDWPAIVARYRAEVESGLDTETFYAEMEKFVFELGDEHSHFESPAQVAESEAQLAGVNNYVGIGVLIQPLLEKSRGTILAVLPNSAAEHGGLKPHDSILSIDGLPLVDREQAYPQRLRGPECSAAVLRVQSPGQEPRDVILVRYRIAAPLPIDARLAPTGDGSHIGYIFLPTFFDETIPAQVRQALEDFGPLDGLILDNRMNGGGSSRVMEPLLGYFASGALGQFVSRTATRALDISADPIHNSQTVPLVVLVGRDTVSFGEIFSGILQAAGRAKIVGQTTLGNVETLHGYTFADGSQVWIAEERFDPIQSHTDWEQDGIQPDVEAYADWDTFTFENDPSVAAALKLLERP